jgi:ParB family chromosome partitioning protein
MTIETVAIETIAMDPANARRHGPRNMAAIEGSLRRFGQQKPIVVDSRGVVRAGNGTLAAAKALGWKEIKIVRSDLPVTELTAYAIADNRAAELAEWDQEVLAKLFAEGELGDVGFDDGEISRQMNAMAKGDDEWNSVEAKFEVVVECSDEEEQKQLFQRLRGEGLTCRLFTL